MPNGISSSRWINSPLSFKNRSGLNCSGSIQTFGSLCTAHMFGTIIEPCGTSCPHNVVGLAEVTWGTPRGVMVWMRWSSRRTASVYGNANLSAHAGIWSRPTTESISFWTLACTSGYFIIWRSAHRKEVDEVSVPAKKKNVQVPVSDLFCM